MKWMEENTHQEKGETHNGGEDSMKGHHNNLQWVCFKRKKFSNLDKNKIIHDKPTRLVSPIQCRNPTKLFISSYFPTKASYIPSKVSGRNNHNTPTKMSINKQQHQSKSSSD
jgi:hypothetical protein